MSAKVQGLMADLAAAIGPSAETGERASRRSVGILTGRANRLSDLAAGAVVDNPQELVDPARCRIWERHNRDYAALSAERCSDLIESMIAQGRQETAAIVRRVHDSEAFDFEVICGARRHWTVAWLRANNRPEIRYLVEVRDLTDEQAFRMSDIENRARQDLSDLERARDYVRAIELYYGGRQKDMARRINVSESWLSRYLDLARLPEDLVCAFADPFELKVSHIGQLKPLLKADGVRASVLAEARRVRLARSGGEGRAPGTVPEVIRQLKRIAEGEGARPSSRAKPPPAPKKTGMDSVVLRNTAGASILRVDSKDRRGLSITLMHKAGATRAEAEAALRDLLDHHWVG